MVAYYGDAMVEADPGAEFELVRKQHRRLRACEPGLERHAALASLLIRLGRLVQGLEDDALARTGTDRADAARPLLEHMVCLARALDQSRRGERASPLSLPFPVTPKSMPGSVSLRTPEGFAYYALYPEAFAQAARTLGGRPRRIIGLRSIGTVLASVVAAQLGRLPVTVRPVGRPFRREVAIAPQALGQYCDPGGRHIVVDEGPGLSGSSLAAVAGWLEEHGVAAQHILLMPAHGGGPGVEADQAIRAQWRRVQCHPAPTASWPGTRRLKRWVEGVVGAPVTALDPVGAGQWRSFVYRDASDWPAIDRRHERIKFLARGRDGDWLVKFAGLGLEGEAHLRAARSLASAGWCPEPAGLAYGFLITPWWEGRPLDQGETLPPDLLARYLAFRVTRLSRPERLGASLAGLIEMARENISACMTPSHARAATKRLEALARDRHRSDAVAVDARLDRSKWLRRSDGRIFKADALDHASDHALIGPQDIAWDIAGAVIEWDMDPELASQLVQDMSQRLGRDFAPATLALHRICYAAFRMGKASLAAEHEQDPDERSRGDVEVSRYARAIGQELGGA